MISFRSMATILACSSFALASCGEAPAPKIGSAGTLYEDGVSIPMNSVYATGVAGGDTWLLFAEKTKGPVENTFDLNHARVLRDKMVGDGETVLELRLDSGGKMESVSIFDKQHVNGLAYTGPADQKLTRNDSLRIEGHAATPKIESAKIAFDLAFALDVDNAEIRVSAPPPPPAPPPASQDSPAH